MSQYIKYPSIQSSGGISESPTSTAANTIQPASASVVPLTLKGAGSQSVDLFDIKDSSNNIYLSVSSVGVVQINTSLGITRTSGDALDISVTNGIGLSSLATSGIAVDSQATTGIAGRFQTTGAANTNTVLYVKDASTGRVTPSPLLQVDNHSASAILLVNSDFSVTMPNIGANDGFTATCTSGVAIAGITTNGNGIVGTSTSGFAVLGQSTTGTGVNGVTDTGVAGEFNVSNAASVNDVVLIQDSSSGLASTTKMLNIENHLNASVFSVNPLGELSAISSGVNIKASVSNTWWGASEPTLQSTLATADDAFVISTVDVAGAAGAASILINGGTSLGHGGGVFMVGGDSTGAQPGGDIQITAGNSATNDGGHVVINSGNGLANNVIEIHAGTMNNPGVPNQLLLISGANSGAGYSGGILLQTFDQANRGAVTIDAASLDMSSKKINNVANPTSAQDAATKAYVDSGSFVGMRYHGATATITGSDSKVTYTTSDYDASSLYASGVFTAGVAGKYTVHAQLKIAGTIALNDTAQLSIYKNGSLYSAKSISVPAALTFVTMDITDDVIMAASDTIQIDVSSSFTTPTVSASNTLNFLSIRKNNGS